MMNKILKILDLDVARDGLSLLGLQQTLSENKSKNSQSDDYIIVAEINSSDNFKLNFENSVGKIIILPVVTRDLVKNNNITVGLELVVLRILRNIGLDVYRLSGYHGLFILSEEEKYFKIVDVKEEIVDGVLLPRLAINITSEPDTPSTTSVKKEIEKIGLDLEDVSDADLFKELKRQIIRGFYENLNVASTITCNENDFATESIEIVNSILLQKRIQLNNVEILRTKQVVTDNNIITSCEKNNCPCLADCWSNNKVCFQLLEHYKKIGDSRLPRFKKERLYELDDTESQRILDTIQQLDLRHIVLSAENFQGDLQTHKLVMQFLKTARLIKQSRPDTTIEVEIQPNLKQPDWFAKVALSRDIDILACKIGASMGGINRSHTFEQLLQLLQSAKRFNNSLKTKTEILLGLDEKSSDVLETLRAVRYVNCDVLVLGQYFKSDSSAPEVKRVITDFEFDYYRKRAFELGFKNVIASTFARNSSYVCETLFDKIELEVEQLVDDKLPKMEIEVISERNNTIANMNDNPIHFEGNFNIPYARD